MRQSAPRGGEIVVPRVNAPHEPLHRDPAKDRAVVGIDNEKVVRVNEHCLVRLSADAWETLALLLGQASRVIDPDELTVGEAEVESGADVADKRHFRVSISAEVLLACLREG